MNQKNLLHVIAMAIVIVIAIGVSHDPAAAQCEPKLEQYVLYSCTITGEDGSQFQDCFMFDFVSGVMFGDFDLWSDAYNDWLACSCQLKLKTVSGSKVWQCVSVEPTVPGFVISFAGKASKKKIKKGKAVNEFGFAFAYKCVADPLCSISAPQSPEAENPYLKK